MLTINSIKRFIKQRETQYLKNSIFGKHQDGGETKKGMEANT